MFARPKVYITDHVASMYPNEITQRQRQSKVSKRSECVKKVRKHAWQCSEMFGGSVLALQDIDWTQLIYIIPDRTHVVVVVANAVSAWQLERVAFLHISFLIYLFIFSFFFFRFYFVLFLVELAPIIIDITIYLLQWNIQTINAHLMTCIDTAPNTKFMQQRKFLMRIMIMQELWKWSRNWIEKF